MWRRNPEDQVFHIWAHPQPLCCVTAVCRAKYWGLWGVTEISWSIRMDLNFLSLEALYLFSLVSEWSFGKWTAHVERICVWVEEASGGSWAERSRGRSQWSRLKELEAGSGEPHVWVHVHHWQAMNLAKPSLGFWVLACGVEVGLSYFGKCFLLSNK